MRGESSFRSTDPGAGLHPAIRWVSPEDAVEEAAKAVESAMNVLVSATGAPLTKTASAQNMFEALKTGGIVPAYTEAALLGAARIRNKIGGHGAGARPRQIDLDEATMTVSATAGALVFLGGRLP